MSDAGANYTRARKLCEKYDIKFPKKILKKNIVKNVVNLFVQKLLIALLVIVFYQEKLKDRIEQS